MAIHPPPLRPRRPSPAIVAQEAVRRFPRWALVLLCVGYIAAGWLGREPWKSQDIAGFGLLFDWMGTSDTAWILARVGAAGLLALTLITTWYSTYYLARRDAAQPVPFAFGGEAKPTDYARAIADGALLALIACLGLAQLAHETTPALLQMASVSLLFFALSCVRYHRVGSVVALILSLVGLWVALRHQRLDAALILQFTTWQKVLHLLAWFTWPAWALALIALTKWRRHWLCWHPATHISLPLLFVAAHILLLPMVLQTDRWLLSALPALACLAAFALPTLRRNMKSVIDLFTLLFFSGCALVIWIVWLAMQTGWPPQPAANVAKLAPLFVPALSIATLIMALAATAAWTWLVVWRLGKHRPAIWMSMVLPASGAALCWMLLMSLWLPLLDHARSYRPLMSSVQVVTGKGTGCIQLHGLNTGQQAAVRYYLDRSLVLAQRGASCDWLVVDGSALPSLPEFVTMSDWMLAKQLRRPTDDNEDWFIYRRGAAAMPNAQN